MGTIATTFAPVAFKKRLVRPRGAQALPPTGLEVFGCLPRTCGESHRRARQPVSVNQRICNVLAIFTNVVAPWLLHLLCGRRWPRRQRPLVQRRGSLSRAA